MDRAALDVAIFLGLDHGGWCPRGRLAEDGQIPTVYHLTETDSTDYAARTEQNVIDSDATLVLFQGSLGGGSRLTVRMAEKHRRPCLAIDLIESVAVRSVQQWLAGHNVQVLNVAGPRASSDPEIAQVAEQFLLSLLDSVATVSDG